MEFVTTFNAGLFYFLRVNVKRKLICLSLSMCYKWTFIWSRSFFSYCSNLYDLFVSVDSGLSFKLLWVFSLLLVTLYYSFKIFRLVNAIILENENMRF